MKKNILFFVAFTILLFSNIIISNMSIDIKGMPNLEKIAFADGEGGDGFTCWDFFVTFYSPGSRLLYCYGGGGCCYLSDTGPTLDDGWSTCNPVNGNCN